MRRWGKEKDKHVYHALSKHLNNLEISLQDFFQSIPVESDNNLKILSKVAEDCQWNRTLPNLFKRLRKLYTNTKFSVRDIKALGKLIKRKETVCEQVNYQELCFHFPGKSVDSLKEQVQILLEDRK